MHNPTPSHSPQFVLALPSPLFQPAPANRSSKEESVSKRKMVSHGRSERPKSFGSELLIRAGIGGPRGKKGKTIVEKTPGTTNNVGFRVRTKCKRDESKSRAADGVSNGKQSVLVFNECTAKKPLEVLNDLLGEVQRDAKKRRTTPSRSKSKSEPVESQPPTHEQGVTGLEQQIEASNNPQDHPGSEPFHPPATRPPLKSSRPTPTEGATVLEWQLEGSKNPQSHRGSEPFRPPGGSPHERRHLNANGRQVKLLSCLTLILQESSAFFKKHVGAESFIGFYTELERFRNAAKRLLEEVDQCICLLREREMQKLEAEKTCIEIAAAAEQVKLLKEVETLECEVASVKAVCSKMETDIARFTRAEDKADPGVAKNNVTENFEQEAETSERD